MAKKDGLHPGTVYALFKELRMAGATEGPLVVEGPPALAETLRRELARGARAGAIRGGEPAGALCYVHVLAAAPTAEDEERLKRARRLRVPAVAVLAGPELDPRVPYVLATDVIVAEAGAGFPLERIARAIAARAGEQGPFLAARIPLLRDAVCEELVETYARRHALVAAAVFVPGADFPVITLGQARMVLRLAAAHGVEVGNERLPEVLAVVGGGFAFRGLARRAAGAVPGVGAVVRAGVAYGGTRAVGEAAVRYFASRTADARAA